MNFLFSVVISIFVIWAIFYLWIESGGIERGKSVMGDDGIYYIWHEGPDDIDFRDDNEPLYGT